MGENSHILIQIVSQPRYLLVLRATIESAMTQLGLSKDQTRHVALAVDEATSNVIRHGYKATCERPIYLKITPVELSGKPAIKIVIEDECTGIDISKIKGRPLDEYRQGGLGIHIIYGVMDFVEYSYRENGKGLRLTMIKCVAASDSEAIKAENPADATPTQKADTAN